MKMNELFEEDLFEMSNFNPDFTGTLNQIWISSNRDGRIKHGPRIKVVNSNGNWVSVSISSIPMIMNGEGLTTKEMKKIVSFIKKNKKVLLKYWNNEIDTPKMVKKIKKA
jgi:hypothetical protein